MRIRSIEAVSLRVPESTGARTEGRRSSWADQPAGDRAEARRPAWAADAEVANPMSKFPRYKRHRSSWLPSWGAVWVKAEAEDGTWGAGLTSFGRPVAAVAHDHLGPLLVGESCFAVEKCWDMMQRASKPYGTYGLASCAISGIDLALWDLAGKLLGQPVYALLGGPARESLSAYATGNDADWYLELGFRAVKLACPHGPADGEAGLAANERLVAEARRLAGDGADVMLDCYMAFDVEYAARLAERLRPYRLRWMEECLPPDDLEAHAELKRRLPWQTLAGGEHMYTPEPFRRLIESQALDILQPDIHWVGGLTAARRICCMADAAGLETILHGGGMNPFGLHLSAAMPNTPRCEYFIGSAPGVPLEEARAYNRSEVPKEGRIFPSDRPGFGLEIEESWLEPYFS